MSKIAAMLAKAREHTEPVLPAAAGSPHNSQGRFARDPGEYTQQPSGRRSDRPSDRSVQLTLIPGGDAGLDEPKNQGER